MSFAQQSLWFLDQLQPGTSAYNLPIALRIEGELDEAFLEKALQQIVTRHEVLRTTFVHMENGPVQIVSPTLLFKLRTVDLSSIADSERQSRAEQLIEEDVKHPFDLRNGPLFRGTLYKLAKNDHTLLLNMHHIVGDGWSFKLILHELRICYESFLTGKAAHLDELPIQYADYAHWQEEFCSTANFRSKLEFWKDALLGAPQSLDLPIAKPRPSDPSLEACISSLLLSDTLTSDVRELSRLQGSTLFMTLITALKVLLYRYTNQKDIVLGTAVANRSLPEVEDLVGCFMNTVALRTQLSGELSFYELLSKVREKSLESYAYQDVPFEKVVEVLQPERISGRNPLFQILFIYQRAFIQPIRIPGITFTPLRIDRKGTQTDMTFFVVEREEGLRVACEYRTDLFDAKAIDQMLRHYEALLKDIVRNPQARIDEFSIVRAEETLEKRNNAPLQNGHLKQPFDARSCGKMVEMTHESIEKILREVWRDVLHIESINAQDDFFAVGGNSLLAVRLFHEIANRLGVNLPVVTLFKASTSEQMAKLICTEKPKDKWTSLVPINAGGTKPPLFLMHAAGGNVLFYKDLADRLGPDQPVYGMQAVGLSGHQSAYDRIEDMAAHYIKEIRGVQPKGPYYVGGSSVGGLIAYEVGLQLARSGEEVGLVVLFDTGAPGYGAVIRRRSRPVEAFLRQADRIQQHVEALRMAESGQRWNYILTKAIKVRNQIRRTYKQTKKRIVRGVLTSLGHPLPDSLVVTQNAIAIASRAYSPGQYDGDILLFRATKQQRGIPEDATLGWSKFAAGKLDIHEVKGGHGTIVIEPRVRFLVETLRNRLGDSTQEIASRGTPEGLSRVSQGA